MELHLTEPRRVVKVAISPDDGWLVELGCGHTVWNSKAPGRELRCGVCAQRLIRQLHRLCAEQAPPPYRKP